MPVYETLVLNNIELPKTDILLFTSPSNVAAYMHHHTLGTEKIIAIGKSTGKQLEMHGYTNYTLPQTVNEMGLVETVLSLE